jgi:hypothetical protein
MRRGWLPAALAIGLASLMFLAVRGRWLDALAVGDRHGQFGLDYFCLPRAWIGLRDGRGLYATGAVAYGPYASSYLSHPLAAVLLGAPLAALAPWTGYWLFLVLSLAALVASAWVAGGTLAPFALLASVPTYLLLWNGQLHFVLVVAVVLLLHGVAHERPQLVAAALLLSLFTKPALLLCAPPLLAARAHRRAVIASLAIWVLISFAFVLAARDSTTHFVAMVQAWNRLGSAAPEWREYFSLPAIVRHYAGRVSPLWFQAPVALLLYLSVRFGGRRQTELCILALVCPFLVYAVVWEYHYAVLAATAPFLLAKLAAAAPTERALWGFALACALSVLVPTPYAVFGGDIETHYLLVRAFRVGPALGLFAAMAVLAARRERVV